MCVRDKTGRGTCLHKSKYIGRAKIAFLINIPPRCRSSFEIYAKFVALYVWIPFTLANACIYGVLKKRQICVGLEVNMARDRISNVRFLCTFYREELK